MAEKRTEKPEGAGAPVLDDETLQQYAEAATFFKEKCEEYDKQIKSHGDASGELKAKLNEVGDVLQKMDDNIEKKFNEFEARLNRKRQSDQSEIMSGISSDHRDTLRKKNFKSYMGIFFKMGEQNVRQAIEEFAEQYKNSPLTGYAGMLDGPKRLKVLQRTDDTLGGYNCPVEFVEQLIIDLQEQNPVRGIFAVRTTDKKAVTINRQTGHPEAQWVEELESRSETPGIAFGRVEIPAKEQHGQVNISREDIEDSFFDMESFIRQVLTEQFARAEGVAFVTGNGLTRPEGFMTAANVSSINSVATTAANITADDFINLYYELKDPYIGNSTWVMKRSTIKEVRKFKDANGNYLWEMSLRREARPSTILDRPYVAADAMDAIGSLTFPVAFGDFRQAYQVIDRLVMEVLTDPYSSKQTGTIEFSARRRVGGKVIQPDAFRKLKATA